MRTTLILLTTLSLAACGTKSSERPADRGVPSPASNVAEATVIDGVQVVEVEASASGYSPDRIALEAGLPARIVFTRTADAACIEHVTVPEYGIESTPLPLGESKAIEFVPETAGAFTFVCGMGMQRGTLVVSV